MTEEDTFRKLRQTPFQDVNDALATDFINNPGITRFVDYLQSDQGNSSSILAEHGWTKAEFRHARNELAERNRDAR
jgi:accessory colonization factor AcfC